MFYFNHLEVLELWLIKKFIVFYFYTMIIFQQIYDHIYIFFKWNRSVEFTLESVCLRLLCFLIKNILIQINFQFVHLFSRFLLLFYTFHRLDSFKSKFSSSHFYLQYFCIYYILFLSLIFNILLLFSWFHIRSN